MKTFHIIVIVLLVSSMMTLAACGNGSALPDNAGSRVVEKPVVDTPAGE